MYNFHDRLVFYNRVLLDTQTVDEHGLPIVKQALTAEGAFNLAMQGITHALYTFWPDVVLIVSGFFSTAAMLDLMHRRNHKIIILATESPYQEDDQLVRAPFCDLTVLNDPVNLPLYDELGVPALYIPHAYRPAVHYPRTGLLPATAPDLTFIGTAFKSRIEFFEAMDFSGLDVLFAGADWGLTPEDSRLVPFIGTGLTSEDCINNTDTAEMYRNSKMGINFYRREANAGHQGDIAVAMGPREVEMAACGLCFLRDPREEGDKVLSMLPTFTSPDDASDQLRWWLAHPVERAEIARQAQIAVQDRTFKNNAVRLLRALESL